MFILIVPEDNQRHSNLETHRGDIVNIKAKYKLKIRVVITTLILLFYSSAKSQDFDNIYSFVRNIHPEENESFEDLAGRLINNNWNEEEKARALFYWIALNIKYDYEGLKTDFWKYYPSDYKIAQDTYEKRKGVCSGYSHLFNLMCKQVGLKSIVIDGYSRIETYQAGLPIREPNHAWNAVFIEGIWKLLDVTWASSNAKNDSINDYYFFTKPEEFVVNHLPENEEWQLLQAPIDKKDFDNYPYISFSYFELGFKLPYPKEGYISNNQGVFEIVIGTSQNYSLLVKIYDYANRKWITTGYTTSKESSGDVLIKIKLEQQGKYLVKVSSLEQGKSNFKIYDGVLYYTLLYEK